MYKANSMKNEQGINRLTRSICKLKESRRQHNLMLKAWRQIVARQLSRLLSLFPLRDSSRDVKRY